MRFLKELIALRRRTPTLTQGETVWLDNPYPDELLTFRRTMPAESVLTAVNFGRETRTVGTGGGEVLFRGGGAALNGGDEAVLPPSGFLISRT